MKPNEELKIPQPGEFVRSLGRLLRTEEIPQPPLTDYIFEQVTATVGAMVNGIQVNSYGTFWDHGGEGSAVRSAIEEAKKVHEQFDGKLTIVVEKETTQVRRRLPEHQQECLYARGYHSFNGLSPVSQLNLPEPVVEVVWSSDNEEPIANSQ